MQSRITEINQGEQASVGSGKQYFFYYVRTNELKMVSHKAFCNSDAKVLNFAKSLVRVVGPVDKKLVRKALAGVVPQGVFSFLGELKSSFEVLMLIIQRLKNISARTIVTFTKLILEIIDFYNSPTISGEQIIHILLSIYLCREELQAQGLESYFLAGISTVLPPKLFEIIRRAQFLSSSKICDDPCILYSIIGNLFSFLEDTLSGIRGAAMVTQVIKGMAEKFKVGKSHILLRKIEALVDESKEGKILLAQSFRDRVQLVEDEMKNVNEILEWTRRSASVASILQKWNRLVKLVESYNNPYRQEPSCFIFEGPPGKMKSVVLNNVVQALGEPCYSHVVKAVGNGKDFYDNYNNEPIFYMDDLGQEGVSQWRTIMNMVSAVKLPLDCADAPLKDTKYFNSDKIFITTNKFQNLNGLTKQDCIDDIKALHRRGYVFDFSHTVRDGEWITGRIDFKYYDLQTSKFLNAFPPEFVGERVNILPYFNRKRGEERHLLIAWMVTIIKTFERIKKKHLHNNKLTSSEMDKINEMVADALTDPEAALKAQAIFSSVKEFFSNRDETEDVDMTPAELDAKLADLRGQVDDLEYLGFVIERPWWKEILDTYFLDYINFLIEGFRTYAMENPDAVCFIVQLGMSILLGVFASLLGNWLGRKNEPIQAQSLFKYDCESVHSSVPFLEKNLYEIEILADSKLSSCVGVFSGHFVLIPAHLAVKDFLNIVVFENKILNNRIIDGEKISLVFKDNLEDVAVYSLPKSYPSPFKKISHLFKIGRKEEKNAYLITSGGWAPIGAVRSQLKTRVREYTQVWNTEEKFVGKLRDGHFATYNIQSVGLCGSLLYAVETGVLGMHVAGDPVNNQGISVLWSDDLKKRIINALDGAPGCIAPFEKKEMKGFDKSVLKLDAKEYGQVPSKTSFGPSPLFGLYPVTRSPADLTKYGFHTVKDVASKSFSPCVLVPHEEIEFGERVLRTMLTPFGDLSETEIVAGNALLAGINKKSSNGFKCKAGKEEYIDFDNKCFREFFREELNVFENNLNKYIFDWEKLVWVETLKDELRSESKAGEPRSFRVGTIFNQVLTKKYFGKMVEHIISNREDNLVMIGCNPIKEWPRIYARLMTGDVFAGDIKKWDGSMVGQVQRSVVDVLLSFYTGSNPVAASVVLDAVVHSLLIVQDDMYITTHSMSSGSFLTAILNSLVNKFYTAMWYFRCLKAKGVKATVDGFWQDVDDFVYGDDKVNVVRRHQNVLNAVTMRDFFRSLNMDFTDAQKNSIERPFQDLSEVSFLKRTFEWHNELLQVVCPLDLHTIFSGLSYVSYDKDINVVMLDKIHAFQREVYLHPNREELLEDFERRMGERKYPYKKLTKSYLKQLYQDPNFEIPLSWSGSLYF